MNDLGRGELLIALAIIAVSSRAAASEPINFHNLDGAATKTQVKEVFPRAQLYTLCPGRVGHLADGDYRCAGLQIKDYVADDQRFNVIFNFKVSGRLAGVLLTKLVGYNNLPAADRLSKGDLDKLYDRESASLSGTYGRPLAGYSPCPVGEDPLVHRRCDRWQSGHRSKWSPGHDYVDLELDVQRDTDTSDTYTGEVTISYEFAPTGEANGP